MAIAFPQADAPRSLSGGADAWDGDAGTLLLDDYLVADAGGAVQDLAAAAIAQASASAALDHAVPLGGAAGAAVAATGALAVAVPLAVSASAAAFAAAELAIAKAMGGGAVGGAGTSAALLVAKALAGAAVAQGAASGELQTGAVGTITTPPLKGNDGAVLANQSGATAYVYAQTGEHVVTKTAQVTDALGVMTIADTLIVAATPYRVVFKLASAAEGMATMVAV